MVSEKKGRGKEVAARGRKRGEARVRSGAAGLLIRRGKGEARGRAGGGGAAPFLSAFGVELQQDDVTRTTGVRAVWAGCVGGRWAVTACLPTAIFFLFHFFLFPFFL